MEFIRQQWRMWIETAPLPQAAARPAKFIRQQWRMWIETFPAPPLPPCPTNSFASNGECGLKHLAGGPALRGAGIHSPAMANVD